MSAHNSGMKHSMRILYLVHGFPPYENAGTEQHTALLAKAMMTHGHDVLVVNATRRLGAMHGQIIRDTWNQINVVRIVNNVAYIPLSQGEHRPEISTILDKEIDRFQPDLIHIQHTQFLTPKPTFNGTIIWTLHDAWGWCPSGGTLFTNHQDICDGPSEYCTTCYSQWQRQPSPTGQTLIKIAGKLSRLMSPDRLHRWWTKIPISVRSALSTQPVIQNPETLKDLNHRQQNFLALANRTTHIVSPSQYLADLAVKQGYPTPVVIPHGIEMQSKKHIGGKGFVFIGTMEPHKGPHIVEKAYNIAFPDHSIPILFVGNGSVQVELPMTGGVSRERVFDLLQHADALIMGSIWPENYPMILLEAKSIGCPVIAPSLGGIVEIITHNVDGLLYPSGDVEILAAQMKIIHTLNLKPTSPRTQAEMVQDYLKLYKVVQS